MVELMHHKEAPVDHHSKKNILLLAFMSIFLFVFMITMVLLNKSSLSELKNVSTEYQSIAKENSLAKTSDFDTTNGRKEYVDNMGKSLSLIEDELLSRKAFLGQDGKTIENDINTARSQLQKKNYKASLETTKKAIADVNLSTEIYSKEKEATIKEINSVLNYSSSLRSKATNIKTYESWALVTVVLTGTVADPGYALLKKEGNSWKLMVGPTTYPDRKLFDSLSVPKQLVGTTTIIIGEDKLAPLKY